MADLHTRIARAYGAIECEKLMSRHVYWHSAGIHRKEYEQYWSERLYITWGHGFGQQANRHCYYNSYVLEKEKNAFKSFLDIREKYPEVENVVFPEALAEYSNHLTTTPIIEVADDGLSAKGLFYTPGFINGHCGANGKMRSQALWERYGADFILEDGKWVYTHLQVCPDIGGNVGMGGFAYRKRGNGGPPPGDMPMPDGAAPGGMPGGPEGMPPMPDGMPPMPEGAAPGGAPAAPEAGGKKKKKSTMPGADSMIEPKIPGPLYIDWTAFQTPQAMPRIPEPYTTEAETWHYDEVKTIED